MLFDNLVGGGKSEGVDCLDRQDTTLVGSGGETCRCREFFESAEQGDIKLFERLFSTRLRDTLCAPGSVTTVSQEAEANNFEGFDPGSERTLAAWIRHASRTNPWGLALMGKWRKGQ